MDELAGKLAAVVGEPPILKKTLADLAVMFQVGPTGREFHPDASCRLTDSGGHLDQPGSPGARLAFPQRVLLAALVVPSPTLPAGQGLGRHFGLTRRGRQVGHEVSQADEQVVGRRVQVEPEQVGEVAMVAEAIGLQGHLEFLVAVLALAAVGVGIVGGSGQHSGAGSVGDHGPAIGALGMGLALDDHPTLDGPRLGLIPEGGKAARRK